MPDAFSPVFAEGISLFQPTATYKVKDNKPTHKGHQSLSAAKHGFARIVEAARHHSKMNGSNSQMRREEEKVAGIAPGARARLIELAKAAKVKAQQKSAETRSESSSSSREEEAGWNCAGLDHAILLNDPVPLPSLTLDSAAGPTHHKDKGEQSRTIKKSASRHRLVDCDEAQTSEEVVMISRFCQKQEANNEESKRSHHSSRRSHSRHRRDRHDEQGSSRGDRDHHEEEGDNADEQRQRPHRSRLTSHTNHSHHASPSPTTHRSHASQHHPAIKQKVDHLPNKRKGKLLDPGVETQRLNLALTMARTRMEMEIAEQQEVEANTRRNGTARLAQHVKDEEEKAWLDEAYEEAVKREVECQYLYDAHALGSTW